MSNSHNFPRDLQEEFMMDPYYIDNIEARCKEIISDHDAMDDVAQSIKILSDTDYAETLTEAQDVLAAIQTNKAKWISTMGDHVISLPPYSYPKNVRNIKSSEITLK